MELMDLARKCRRVYNRAEADLGSDLGGFSLLDLCADKIPEATLFDLEDAIITAGLYSVVSDRLKKEIAAYRHNRVHPKSYEQEMADGNTRDVYDSVESALDQVEIIGEAELIDRLLATDDSPPRKPTKGRRLFPSKKKGPLFNPRKKAPKRSLEIDSDDPPPKFSTSRKKSIRKRPPIEPSLDGPPIRKKSPPKKTRRFPPRPSATKRRSTPPSDDISPLDKYTTLPIKGLGESLYDELRGVEVHKLEGYLVNKILNWWESEANSIARENKITGDGPTDPNEVKNDPFYQKEVLAEYIESLYIPAAWRGFTIREVKIDVADELGIDYSTIRNEILDR